MPHPAACLLAWMIVLVALQCLGWTVLGALALVIAATGPAVRRRWWRLTWRAKWLFLSLLLILAYGTPGEPLVDASWAPTEAGVAEAGVHVLRLVLMLGSLAWLFESLPRERILAGLWAAARPLGACGLDVDRLVVRLSLVFDIIQEAPKRGNWRQLLEDEPAGTGHADTVRIELPRWLAKDTAVVLAVALFMTGAGWLS